MQKTRWMMLVAVLAVAAQAQQDTGALKGKVTDSSGAVVPGAKVTVIARGVAERTVETDQTGSYTVTGLAPGTYALRVVATGFGMFRARADVVAGRVATVDASLQVALEKQEVTVEAEGTPAVSTEAANNAGALVLRGDDLDALSDDPDELQDDLQALAGPSAGPSGGEIYVDGFTNARLPPKASIREIRINQNPFSSEFDRLGYGRIEILTKPGTDKFHGQLQFTDTDSVFNARNPFAENKPDFFSRQYSGNLTGPLGKRASFFLDFERRNIEDNALIEAIDPLTFDPNSPLPPRQAVVTPQERTSISPRLDYQLTQNQTLVIRYGYVRNGQDDSGLTGFALIDQAYKYLQTQQDVQVTDTIVLSPHTINETRFHFGDTEADKDGTDNTPTIQAPDFTYGGASVGHAVQNEKYYELQNFTTIAQGAHGLKFGLRARELTLDDSSPTDFAGAFFFDSIEQYAAAQQAAPGHGVASKFTYATGTPLSSLSRIDVAPFVQDDWRARPNLTLSLGLRYEVQTNIHDWHNIAPRFGFAWSPDGGAKGNGKTVVRGGFGIFYDRISESLTLETDRFNGGTQQSFIVLNPDFYPIVPPISELGRPSVYQLQPGLRAPRTMQSALGVERQVSKTTTVATTFIYTKSDHQLRTIAIEDPADLIYQYQANGAFEQEQWITNVNTRLSKDISLFAFYVMANAMSDTDSSSTFPENPNNFSEDWSRSSLDVRNRFVMGGSIMTRWGVRLSPFIIARSGAPFNIVTGTDVNSDTPLTERPAFATAGEPGAIDTQWGWFINPALAPNATIIPRNYGTSPGYFGVNLRLSKVFGFGEPRSAAGAPMSGGGPRGGGPVGMAGGGRGGMRGVFSDPLTDHRFNLTVSISARNLLNSTNPGPFQGNLSSAFFGQSSAIASPFGGNVAAGSASAADNRRIDLGIRLNF